MLEVEMLHSFIYFDKQPLLLIIVCYSSCHVCLGPSNGQFFRIHVKYSSDEIKVSFIDPQILKS